MNAPVVQKLTEPVADDLDTSTFRARANVNIQEVNPVLKSFQEALEWVDGQTTNINNQAAAVTSNANAASLSASAAAVHAAAAAATSTAPNWVSGTTYAVDEVRRSLLDGLPYRRTVAGDGTTDPANDPVNWELDFLNIATGLPEIRPSLLLDPENQEEVDARIVCTRAGDNATFWDRFGVLRTAPANTLRINHDPVTGKMARYLVEVAATNQLLNSLIDGTPLSTQNVTVTATQQCISFYGTGTITLSGAHSASIVGAGAYPARTFLAFTPSAGTLTVTVSGDVTRAQLETGVTHPTSFIPTAGAAVTRAADVPVISGDDFAGFFNQAEGTFVFSLRNYFNASSSLDYFCEISFSSSAGGNRVTFYAINSRFGLYTQQNSVELVNVLLPQTFTPDSKFAVSIKSGLLLIAVDGVLRHQSAPATAMISSANQLHIGRRAVVPGVSPVNIETIKFYPRASTVAQLVALSRI